MQVRSNMGWAHIQFPVIMAVQNDFCIENDLNLLVVSLCTGTAIVCASASS